MSFELSKKFDFSQPVFQFLPLEINEEEFSDLPLQGGIFFDLKHVWHTKGPCIEVRHIVTGKKVGSWAFGGSIKDLHTKIVCVDELKTENGRLPLLLVALDTVAGGQICVLDVFSSRVLRAINIEDQISSMHIVDSGNDLSIIPEPSPFRYFDGIVAVGTRGGSVYLVDICRQICEDALENPEVSIFRDELYPCDMIVLPQEKLQNIKKYIERSMENSEHIGVHINAVTNPKTDHFTLQGEKGEDRVYVNKSEVEVSSLHFSTQLASLLIGYNFGAFQLWDLRHLYLAYTSPICDEHIPITHFAVQEPADDPKAYCYVWVSYSQNLLFSSGMPYAVMYSFYYDNKKYLAGFGNLYEKFQHCSVRFQIELGTANLSGFTSRIRGGSCIGIQSIGKNLPSSSLALCLVSWLLWDSSRNLHTCMLLFDLNQWYKEQMPNIPEWSNCSNYIIKNGINTHLMAAKLDVKSISQYVGVQKLEEHFCPTSLNFDMVCMSDSNVLKIHNKSFQKALIEKLEVDGHLALCRPSDYYEQIISLGLVPIFFDMPANLSNDTGMHRDLLLSMILEQKLVHWLCKCASKLANDAFNSQGLPLSSLLGWAFQRALSLKASCDHFCTCLFDYSGIRLDTNTIALVSNSTSQIKNICSFYNYVSTKLLSFICDKDTLLEEQRCLQNVTLYYEVLLWMVNIGLLPEGQNTYKIGEQFAVVYEVDELTKYYIGKRTRLREVSHQTFVEKDCLLFIDNLINNQSISSLIRQHWQEDGGSGLYPPPSLQSALRIYLLDGMDLVFKHSLLTYTLLDIAMTLDGDEQVHVVKMLLKFPQIFDLSQSRIKIVQAFWHLDHDDYQTALDYILDPSVLADDLQQWHHSVMLRSLFLQDQFTLALLYLQIRKPSLSDEKDLLTVLSLLISKNMLDEAFRFQQNHRSKNGELLLMHIFNECTRNEQLHSLLFRCLNTDEERAFFKYLQTTKSPRTEDLKIFYYLLRSRFLEAFDTYSNCKNINPETHGLIGQGGATTVDNVVKLFKNLMPDVNKNLVDIVRKERSNLWKEVSRPTPLSVFAHNVKEKVCYKSDVIFATLSKAKRTFNDSFCDMLLKDVNTESTPFLRTPAGLKNGVKLATPVVNCTIIEQHENEDYEPSPRKKLKLSPRLPTTSPTKIMSNISINKTLLKIATPIVKRKLSMDKSAINNSIQLPHSILKCSRTFNESSMNDRSTNNLSMERSRYVLNSRKSMTPSKVKFNDLRYSTSSNEQSSPKISDHSTRESENISNEDTFYSPSTSPVKDNQGIVVEMIINIENDKERCKTPENLNEIEDKDETPNNEMKNIVTDYSKHRMVYQSPKSRRSYKRFLGESPIPIRSSPRLSHKFTKEGSPTITSDQEPCLSESQPPKPSPSVAVQKLRGRRSLARAVLEHNTFSKTRVSTYTEKSILNVTEDSDLSSYCFEDSSIDTDEESVQSPTTPDTSLIKLLKECKDVEYKSYTDTDSLTDGMSDKDIDGNEVFVDDKKLVTMKEVTTVKESSFTETVEVREITDVDEEMMDIQASVIDSIMPDSQKNNEFKINNVQSTSASNADDVFQPKENNDDNIQIESKANSDTNKEENLINEVYGDFDENVETQGKPTNNDEENLLSAVYDDLSSGSEDLRDILEKNNSGNDVSTSQSLHRNEKSEFSNECEKGILDASTKSSQISQRGPGPLDQGFTADVIEIGSSDEEVPKHVDTKLSSSSSSDTSSDSSKSPDRNIHESGSSDDDFHYNQDKASSNSEDSQGDFEKNIFYEENSLHIQTNNFANGSASEPSEHDGDSRDSQKTERISNYGDKDNVNNSDSSSSVSQQVADYDDSSCDSQATEKAPPLEEDNLIDENPIQLENIDTTCEAVTEKMVQPPVIINIEEKQLVANVDTNKIENYGKPVQDVEIKINQVEEKCEQSKEKQTAEEICEAMEVTDIKDKKKTGHNILVKIPNVATPENPVEIVPEDKAECEEMETLQLEHSNPNSPEKKQLNKTSKALQCTLRYSENPADEEEKTNVYKDEQEIETEKTSIEDDHLSKSDDTTEVNESLISTPHVLKHTIKKTYSKIENQERELNKTPVLKPVEKTYLRRGRLTSQSSTLSENESGYAQNDPATTSAEQSSLSNADETVKPRRITRRMSANFESSQGSDSLTPSKLVQKILKTDLEVEEGRRAEKSEESDIEETGKPKRITRRMSANFESSQASDSPTPSKLITKILKTDLEVEQSSTPGTPRSKGRPSKSKTSSQVSNLEENVQEKSKATEETAGPPSVNIEKSEKSNIEETGKPKRITHRMSANFKSSQASDSPTPSKLITKILKTDLEVEQSSTPGTPRSKGRPSKSKTSSQVSSFEENVQEKSKATEEIAGPPLEISKIGESTSQEIKPRKRLRSASVDQSPQPLRTYSRKLRSKSIDEPIYEETVEAVIDSKEQELKIMLEPISEVSVSRGVKGKAKADLGTYTTARRLTRTQASMLKTISEVKKDSAKLPSVEEMDPIILLDKPPFQGDPDPEESKVCEPGSPSGSSPSVSASQRSRRRSASVVSDATSMEAPSVSSRASKSTGIKSRLRTASAEGNSDVSDSPSPSKKTKKALPSKAKETSQITQKNTRTRTRTTSGSSNRSNVSVASDKTNTSTRSTRARKLTSKKELPEIQEEKDSEEKLETTVTSKRGRPKKKN